ncbi:MAG: type III pantothenate kinase [Woeseiaceae bacterium]|nr:type III pantothenate kinase [Woeseiaceae bacterium]
MKALLIDAGNTRLKWGIATDGEIHRTGHITQAKIREQGIGVLTTRLPQRVDAVIASNVAGTTFATRLAGIVGAHCGLDLRFAKTEREAYGVTNAYAQPRRMGVDRWVALVGARAELGTSCIVVDAGTAVTIDALDDSGRHLGGQILPGVRLMASALASDTSDLPETKLKKPGSFTGLALFAGNTADAIGSGSENAVVGAVERALRTLQADGHDPQLVLTGGDAARILEALDEPALHLPNLVLQGLMHMLESDGHL